VKEVGNAHHNKIEGGRIGFRKIINKEDGDMIQKRCVIE
jgi:hypothetical protein